MSTVTATPTIAKSSAAPSRRRLLVFPREHGAWGLLFVPLLTGALAAIHSDSHFVPLALFAVAAFALFCLRTPVESLLGTSPIRAHDEAERALAWTWVRIYGAVAVLALAQLFHSGYWRGLGLIGAAAALAFSLQVLLRKLSRRLRLISQVVGAAGLTSTAAAAYYLATGRLDLSALVLWALNFVFAAGQLQYVHLRIHENRWDTFIERLEAAPGFFAMQLLLMLAVDFAVFARFLPILTILVILPALWRGFYWYFEGAKPLDVHRLGWQEMRQGALFGVLLILAFRLNI